MSTIDYAHTIVSNVPENEHRGLVFPQTITLAAGEYADQGEPDFLIDVQHALDTDGNDMRMAVALALSEVVKSAAFRQAVASKAALSPEATR